VDRQTVRADLTAIRRAAGRAARHSRCLADREQRHRASTGDPAGFELADVVDAARLQAGEIGDLAHADRGLREHSVHPRWAVAVRRDLR
jgi:hypothetical protein